jgi:hypothetical protein
MARGDGEWWLRGRPIRRRTSNPASPGRARVVGLIETGLSAFVFVTVVDRYGWLIAIAAVAALALIGIAVGLVLSQLRTRLRR